MKNYLKLKNSRGVAMLFEQVKNLQPTRNTLRLWQCYKNPSRTKERIYDNWNTFAIDCYLTDSKLSTHFGILSYNTNFFTLGFFARLENIETGELNDYYIKITPSHNYCQLL